MRTYKIVNEITGEVVEWKCSYGHIQRVVGYMKKDLKKHGYKFNTYWRNVDSYRECIIINA